MAITTWTLQFVRAAPVAKRTPVPQIKKAASTTPTTGQLWPRGKK